MPHAFAISLRSRVLAGASLAIMLASSPAWTQQTQFRELDQEIAELDKQGNYKQAVILAAQALNMGEKALGPEHPDVARRLDTLASLYYSQGEYALAEPLFKRALAVAEKVLGANHPETGRSLIHLAQLYKTQGHYALAEPLYKRSLAIAEKSFGPEHPNVAASLNNLADLYKAQGLYSQAVSLNMRALAIREKALGANDASVATSLNNLASLHHAQGQYAQAETLYKRSLAILEKSLGAEHPLFGSSLNNLARLYTAQGKYAEAEPLVKRALAIKQKSLGANHPTVAVSLNNLASFYQRQGKFAQAEPLYQQSLAILEMSLGAEHPEVATGLNNLAMLHARQGHDVQAEPMYKRALAIREKALGPNHPEVAYSLNNLALLYYNQGQYAQAEPLYQRALAINEKALGASHPRLAANLNYLARLYAAQGQHARALGWSRRATAIYRRRIVDAGVDDSVSREAAVAQGSLAAHLALLSMNPEKDPPAKVIDEALQIVQLIQSSGTSSAIAKMAARFGSGNDVLAQLAKRKQDAAQRRSQDEAQLVRASSQPPAQRDGPGEERLRAAVAQTASELAAIDAELTRRFPAYQELVRPEPVTVTKIQSLLKPGEAMLVYALAADSYVWVITAQQARFRVLKVKIEDVSAQVAKVRSQMELDDRNQAPKLSVDVLHDLYKNLFAPVLPDLAGVSHVMVVPSGPLQSLPLAMLVSTPPPDLKTVADYRNVQWLLRSYAFSVLPSVSSIQAFRQFAKPEPAPEPFAGFGDPMIGKGSSPGRGMRAKLDVAAVFRNVPANNANGPAGGSAADIADVDFIRRAPRLPETADELRSMATTLKAGPQSVWLQAQATETRVKTMDLSRYRTLAFATHGALAGEIQGIGEPGLVLTPPAVGTLEDDGYLSAGEIAKLNLNADWVVLSACNTAAANGTPGAEGLSGIAKAFFYAGARSLLVSHWPVASQATVPLTTVMLQEYASNPKLGKAQAQRKAMLALIDTPGHAEYAHPLFWAPFVIVGEGGAGLAGK